MRYSGCWGGQGKKEGDGERKRGTLSSFLGFCFSAFTLELRSVNLFTHAW